MLTIKKDHSEEMKKKHVQNQYQPFLRNVHHS